MTTYLYSVPAGWILSIISVSVVFLGLIVLYFLYSISGKIFTKAVRKSDVGEVSAETAAAIALAVQMELSCKDDGNVYDTESGIITIRKNASPWADKSLSFRKNIR